MEKERFHLYNSYLARRRATNSDGGILARGSAIFPLTMGKVVEAAGFLEVSMKVIRCISASARPKDTYSPGLNCVLIPTVLSKTAEIVTRVTPVEVTAYYFVHEVDSRMSCRDRIVRHI